jgi:WD40 repeat protein
MKSKSSPNANRTSMFLLICFFLTFSSVLFAQKTELVVPAKHSKAVISAIYSGDGKKIISIGSDQTLKVWNATDGLLLSTIKDTLIKYEALSLLPDNHLIFIRTNKGYQILDSKKNKITVSRRIPKYVGGSLLEGSSDFYYAKGIEGTPGEKALYKLFKYNLSGATLEEPLAEFKDPDGRIAWTLSFTQGRENILIKLSILHSYLYTLKDKSLIEIEQAKFEKKSEDGTIDINYLPSQLGTMIELSHYRGKRDYTIKYIDWKTNAIKKTLTLKGILNYEATPNGLFYLSDDGAGIYDEKNDKLIQLTVPRSHQVLSYDGQQNKLLLADTRSGINISTADAGKGKIDLTLGGKTLFTSGTLENDKAFRRFYLASGTTQKYLNISDGRIQLSSNQGTIFSSPTVYPDFEKSLVREKVGDSILTYQLSKTGVKLLSSYNLKELIQREFSTKKPYAFAISADGKLIALGNSEKTIVYDLLLKKVINTYSLLATVNKLCFSATGDYLFTGVELHKSADNDEERLICYKTTGSPSPIWKKKRWKVEKIAVDKNEPNKLQVVVTPLFNDADQNVQGNEGYYELQIGNGNILDYIRGPILFEYANLKIMSDTKTIMYATGKYLHSLSKVGVNTIAETYNAPNNATTSYGNFYSNEFLIYPAADGSYAIFDLKRGVKIADLYLFDQSKDWMLMTRDGRFDGTSSATRALYYVRNDAKIDVDAVYEKFYTPNLLMRLLSRENLPPIDVNLDDLRPKPKVKIQYSETKRNLEVENDIQVYANATGIAEITVNATAPDDKVDEIRLFHNGKAVNLTTRGLLVADADGFDSKKYTISLLPGNNNFSAVALNSQRTESEPDQIVVNYKKAGTTPATPKVNPNQNIAIDQIDPNATLHIVVVGINAYKNKINPLTYAIPDAKAFKAELEQDAKSIASDVKSYLIQDDQANKAGILAAFENIKKTAKPEDVFVFYYAGHGYIHPSNNEFYLVSADVGDSGESLLKNGISAKQLQAIAVEIPAQKQLFIMDACQSAGAFEKMQRHDGEQQKSIAVISRSTGTHWMAASGSTETAKEFGQLGHGVFTYSLLEALKGKAANNKMITVNGLKDYLQEIVPELVKKYGSSGQSPASFGFGNDFPIEVIK